MVSAAETDRRRRRRWLRPRTMFALAIVGAALGVFLQMRWNRRQIERLVSEVNGVRGTVSMPPSILQLTHQLLRGDFEVPDETSVRLRDPALREGWLRDHGNLSELQITAVDLRGTREFDADDAGLFRENPVERVHVALGRNVDRVAAALTGLETLNTFDARGSDLTDEGLGLLPLERLRDLQVENSTITAAGLLQLRRCAQLEQLSLDGDQLTAELVAVLKGLPELTGLRLVGRKVTDEHIKLLSGLEIERFAMERTSVTFSAQEVDDWRRRRP